MRNDLLIKNLQNKICNTLDLLIPADSRCALIGFPNHKNVGDSTIYAGEERYLKSRNVDIVYECCDNNSYSQSKLKNILRKDDIILFHGGGNFGDLWYDHQLLRERVMNNFRAHKFIQLPQSVYFMDVSHAEPLKKIFGEGINFKMLVRDKESQNRFENIFNQSADICPDMALMIGSLNRIGRCKYDILGILRTDQESAIRTRSWSFPVCDWGKDDINPLMVFMHILFLLKSSNLIQKFRQDIEPKYYSSYASMRINRGIKLLSKARVIVTDRLHAHIMCILMDIPHVVVDNSYGKLSSFINLWTIKYGKFKLAKNFEEAEFLAKELLLGS
jgi:pyruvyl transferase EpsO